ncbi:MAG: hypothetical protein ACLFT6_08585 [Bacteroidales bacterium]
MPARYDLPDDEIFKLRENEDLSFKEIKEKLELDCHADTVARHYHQYKKEMEELEERLTPQEPEPEPEMALNEEEELRPDPYSAGLPPEMSQEEGGNIFKKVVDYLRKLFNWG